MPDAERSATSAPPLSWREVLDESSRIHTTRTRKDPLTEEVREDAHPLDIYVDERPATLIPTRMDEPGFYLRWEDDFWSSAERKSGLNIERSEMGLAGFRVFVEAGRVVRRVAA